MQLAPPTGSHGNPITIEIESDALMVLSCLCENNIHRKVTKSSVIIILLSLLLLHCTCIRSKGKGVLRV